MSEKPTSAPAPEAALATADAAPREDYSQRVTYTYLVGVFVAINAIRDAYLLVEGPDCAHMKTQFVQGNHDWMSTLTSVSGYHRIANTALHPSHMTSSREQSVSDALMALAKHEATGGVLLTSMPMAFITGADYERLCGDVAEATGKMPIHIPGKSLSGDWLDGYDETLLALASQLDLSGGDPQANPNKVAIIGNLFDRNEEDQRANTRELRRLIEGMGLELTSVWLDGGDFADLSAARDAGVVISLPYARRAAKAVVRQTGAKLIKTDLPFGLPATEHWLRTLGDELGRRDQAEALIERELTEIIPRLEWVIPHQFQGKRFGFVGDPYLVQGMNDITKLLGAELGFVVIPNPPRRTRHFDGILDPGTKQLIWPKMGTFRRFVLGERDTTGVDLLVTNDAGSSFAGMASFEFGFPSFHSHHLFERPSLGFRGFMAFADSMANTMARYELAQGAASME